MLQSGALSALVSTGAPAGADAVAPKVQRRCGQIFDLEHVQRMRSIIIDDDALRSILDKKNFCLKQLCLIQFAYMIRALGAPNA